MSRIDEITIREVDQRDPVEMARWLDARIEALQRSVQALRSLVGDMRRAGAGITPDQEEAP